MTIYGWCSPGRVCMAALASTVAAAALSVPPAQAQAINYDRGQNQGVLERAAENYGPDGMPLGGFRLFPTLDLQEYYDDNIYAYSSNRQDDAISVIQPELRLASNWKQNQLALYGQDSLLRYVNHTTENSNEWTLGGSGQLDVQPDWSLQGRVEHQSDVEPRTDPSTPVSAARPTIYDLQLESVEFIKTFNRLRLNLTAEDQTYSYGRVPLNGGFVLDESYRNNSHLIYGATAQFAVSPELAVYSMVKYNVFNFAHFYPNVGVNYLPQTSGGFTPTPTFVNLPRDLNQNSDGYTADVGANFDLTHLARGSLGVGYLAQNAHDPRLPDYSGPHGQAQVDYFLTPLLTLHFTTTRSVSASGLTASPAFLATDVRGAADYELLSYLIFQVTAGGGWDNYKGIGRNDTRQDYTASGTYYVGRHLSLVIRYSRLSLSSRGSGAGPSYSDDRAGLSLIYAR